MPVTSLGATIIAEICAIIVAEEFLAKSCKPSRSEFETGMLQASK
jgi:hypothetical protein